MGGDYMSPENHWSDMDVGTMGKGGKKGSKGYKGKGKGDWFKGKGKSDWTKGKGKAKGKGDKGKGKGFQGACYHCGHYGHTARECGEMNPFQGTCTKCVQWGHMAKDCRVGGRIQEIRQDIEEDDDEQEHDHRHIGTLEMGGSICAVDKNWRKDKNDCFVDASEWTQVRRREVIVIFFNVL